MTSSFVDLWDQAVDSWDDFIETGKDVHKDLIIAPATLGLVSPAPSPDQKALDLCCGEGYYSRKLKALGYDTYGVDISEKTTDLACRKAKDITYFCSDAHVHYLLGLDPACVPCATVARNLTAQSRRQLLHQFKRGSRNGSRVSPSTRSATFHCSRAPAISPTPL